MATSTMTYDERLDAVRAYLAESDRYAMELKGNLDTHNCVLDKTLREMLATEADIGDDEGSIDIMKRSEFAIRSIAVMVVMSSIPVNPILSGILTQCVAEGIMKYVEFGEFLPRLHAAVHAEEILFINLLNGTEF